MNISVNDKEKRCPKCKIIKNRENDFYKIKGQSIKVSGLCKECVVVSNKERQRNTKRLAVNYKGGECVKCGYNKCIGALEFHHLDPTTKDKDYFNSRGGLTVDLKKELDKCILICANCHREEHHCI